MQGRGFAEPSRQNQVEKIAHLACLLDIGCGRFGNPRQSDQRVLGTPEHVVDLIAEKGALARFMLRIECLYGLVERSNSSETVAAHECMVEEAERESGNERMYP